MKPGILPRLSLIVFLVLTACTIDVSQPGQSSRPGDNQNPANGSVPVTWKSLGLQGSLVYITSRIGSSPGGVSATTGLQTLDLSSGEVKTVFEAPQGAWIDFVSSSPDGKNLALEYVPSAGETEAVNPGQQSIYTLPTDGSTPLKLLLRPPSDGDLYYHPTWSPDGRYVYFAHANFKTPYTVDGQAFPIYSIFRMEYPDGQPEKLADQAFWPRLSEDGSLLVYVSFDPVDGSNQLFVANADGSNSHQVLISGSYVPTIIDAPSFSPDDKLIYFSAASPAGSFSPSWVDRLFGITVASAHVVQSDWWSVPVRGGAVTRLTHISTFGMFGAVSPDNQHAALYTGNGLLAMNLDGSGLTTLIKNLGGVPGSVGWLP